MNMFIVICIGIGSRKVKTKDLVATVRRSVSSVWWQRCVVRSMTLCSFQKCMNLLTFFSEDSRRSLVH